ncbi:MAG: DUF2726 domain-containing protein [Alphaproteobacteria bacterium]|nr:DUF2726 domain-containing protein [Alphaproteobacteria bacterium]
MSHLVFGDASFVVGLTLVLLLFFLAGLASGPTRPKRWRRLRLVRPWSGSPRAQEPDLTDVGEQLKAVMASSFSRQRVLSPSEYRPFKIIEAELMASRSGYRVFAQTSLGEILRSPCHSAFRSINSKRVDILVIDQYGWPVVAVEFQGAGHYQGTAAARDAVKKEALRKAGVRYIEVSAEDGDEEIRSRLRAVLGWSPGAPVNGGASQLPDSRVVGLRRARV